MKSLKFLATAAIVSAFALTSCVQDVLETGIDTSKPGVTNLTYGEVAHGSKTMTLYWSGAEAVNAGATSFSVQFLENKDTLGGKLLKPDMYDPSISKTVEVVKDEDGLVSTTDFSAQMEGQTVGNKYYIRVRANYPMSIYSDWTWLTDAQGNIAYFKVGRGIITEGIEDPYLFKVTGTSTGLIVKWDAIPDATSYQVEYKKSSESSWTSETVPAGADLPTILKIKNLPSETSYDVRAKTITPAGDSEYCDVQTVSTRKPGSFPKSMKDAKELIDWLEGGVVEVEPSDVFTLAADIDLTGQTFTAMDESLLGTFDGANHTIKGVSSTLLYDIESTGTVKNLTIEGTMNSSDENFAGLALSNKGTITDVEVKANINYDATLSSLMKVGGIVADNTGTLKKVTYSGTLAATSSQNVAGPIVIGGLAAYSAGTIEDSHNKGPVSFKTANYIQGMAVAGLVGYLENAITGSDNSGAIAIEAANAVAKAALINTSSATPTVAGIAGYGNTDAFAITDCTNDGLVSYTLKTIDLQKDGKTTASANYNRTQVGGIVGNPYGKVTRAINNGTISINMGTSTGEVFTGSNHEHIICAGGIGGGDFFAGADQNKTSYIDCVNNGKINAFVGSAQSNSAIGGIVGWPGKEGSRTNSTSGCKNTGNITLTGPGKVRCGGIHGGSGIITNCENSGNIVANDGTACSLGGLAGFSSNGFKITGSRSTGNVTGNVSGFNVGGLLGNIGNSAGSGGFTGCSVSATVKAADPDQATSGMIIGYYNGTSAATSAGTAASPVLVNGIYNGTKLTAGNFSNYLEGKNNKADVHEMYAKFDETPYESEGGEEPVTPALESPQNVKVEVFYDYTTISWDAVNGAEWYVVEYKKSGTDNWVPCEKTENTTYTIEGLDHGSSYSFRVKAYTSTGSGYSDEASAETYEEVNLGAPVITGATAGPKTLEVKWNAVEKATAYKVEYLAPGADEWTVATERVEGTTYTISGLKPETTYQVRVKALGEGGNEAKEYSEPKSFTTEAVSFTYPLTITDPDDFALWVGVADLAPEGAVVTLGKDLDMNGIALSTGTSFSGTLDGAGKTLKNIKANGPLFNTLSGTVKDLTLEGAFTINIDGDDAANGHPLATIANVSTGNVTGCTNKATVTMTGTGIIGSPVVAGIVAFQKGGTFKDNKNLAAITLTHSGTANAAITGFNRKPFVVTAGVVGVLVSATAENCTNEGAVKVLGKDPTKVAARHYVGGVIGTPEDARVINCTNRGSVLADFTDPTKNAAKQVWVGGIIGGRNGDVKTVDGAYVEGCNNYGDCTLIAENSVNNYLAGIGGQATVEATGTNYTADQSTIQKIVGCNNYGKLTKKGAGGCRLGGISGGAATLENCTNSGDILVENISTAGAVGGLVGYPTQAYHPIKGCKNTGNMTATCDVVFAMGGLFGQGGNTTQTHEGCSVNCTMTAPEKVLTGLILGTAKTLSGTRIITYGTSEAPFKVKGTVKGVTATADNFTTLLVGDGGITAAETAIIETTNVQFGE